MTLTGVSLISMGSEGETIAHPADIFRAVIASGNQRFVLIRNHPGGNPSPSPADHSITRNLREGAGILKLEFVDHLIVPTSKIPVGIDPYFSFRESGLL